MRLPQSAMESAVQRLESMRLTRSIFLALYPVVAIAITFMPHETLAQRFLGSAAAYSQQDRAQSLLRDVPFGSPLEIASTSANVAMDLHVVEVVNHFNEIDLRHRSYNCGLVGPTVRVRPGQRLRVRMQNDLAPEPVLPHAGNIPHGFNTTNLHTHGLHVSPKSPADDVFREINPGTSFAFEFPISAEHPAGTFWYHAHKHGSTALQLASGMSGALIVEGGLDQIPEIRAADEKILVLQQFVYKEVAGSPAIIDPTLLYSGTGTIVTAINGVVTPTIVMRPGEVQRWRVIHAGTTEAIFLDAEGVTFHEIAVDGLATGRLEEKNSLQLYPGYRSDILVKAPRIEGARLVYSVIRDPEKAILRRQTERQNILRIVVEGAPLEMPLPTQSALQKVAAFDSGDVPRDDEIVNRRVLRFSQDGNRFLINGEEFDPNSIEHTLNLETAEEWELISESGVHPFHIHVNPFAVKPTLSGEPWVWRDTIAVRRREPVTIRTRFKSYSGKTVLHCHNLTHEDHGMMQAIEIAPGSRGRAGTPQKEAPKWSAVDSAGRSFSGDEFRGHLSMLVFHRGMSCLHCAEQMTMLKDQHDALRLAGVNLIAISQYLPEEPEVVEALRRYPFPILIDRELKSFRKYDCIDEHGQPVHGVFVIDRNNRLILEHRTETAVADPAKLLFSILGKEGQ